MLYKEYKDMFSSAADISVVEFFNTHNPEDYRVKSDISKTWSAVYEAKKEEKEGTVSVNL